MGGDIGNEAIIDVDEGEGEAEDSIAMANLVPNQRNFRQMGANTRVRINNQDFYNNIDSLNVNIDEHFNN